MCLRDLLRTLIKSKFPGPSPINAGSVCPGWATGTCIYKNPHAPFPCGLMLLWVQGIIEGEREERCPVPEAVGVLEAQGQKGGRVCFPTLSGGGQALTGGFPGGIRLSLSAGAKEHGHLVVVQLAEFGQQHKC